MAKVYILQSRMWGPILFGHEMSMDGRAEDEQGRLEAQLHKVQTECNILAKRVVAKGKAVDAKKDEVEKILFSELEARARGY